MNSTVATTKDSIDRYRVMVVDDSAIIRGFLSRYLSEDPSIEVVTTANNGEAALHQLDRYDLEVVVLDIEMPEMDGLTALPKLIEMRPDLQVVMASTLTMKNAEISLEALQLGAVDYVPKPETARNVNASIDFRRELVEKVKAWAGRRRKKLGQKLPEVPAAVVPTNDRATGFVTVARKAAPQVITSGKKSTAIADPIAAPTRQVSTAEIKLRQGARVAAEILAIGSSTGGPQALMRFFAGFKNPPKVPVVITQHMPAQFTAILATHLAQSTGWPAQEAKEGMAIKAGEIYVAPGGLHLEFIEKGGQLTARLSDAPPENFCKPAVDPMLRSLAPIFGNKTLIVILTGMGHDGLKGARDLAKDGATVLAQNEATSVVWGMPGAVATAGLCTEVLPIDDLGAAAAKRLQGAM